MKKQIRLNDEIISQIYFIRGQKVMLDSDLARIYGVTTARLNQQVRRNLDRFPADFMFELTSDEFQNLMLQIATSSLRTIDNTSDSNLISQNVTSRWGGRRKLPFVFTEHGALMLASVLNSSIAIQASIFVVRAFVALRELITSHKELSDRIDDLEKRTCEKLDEHSEQLMLVFQALRELVRQKEEPRNPLGFKIGKNMDK
ncbi:MAG: ORF6N domain-containing protein [Bacteroidales bacterium]|nr:ORF6N domain-containing protein [Bacteroidales bacterium]